MVAKLMKKHGELQIFNKSSAVTEMQYEHKW